jgi:HNH endonuclease
LRRVSDNYRVVPPAWLFTLANPLGGEQEVAASETPANPFGSTLITLARAIERLYEILQHPAVQTAYGTDTDQVAAGRTGAETAEPAGPGGPAAADEPAGPGPSLIPAPVGERAKRSIPQDVKIAVSARDGGRCRQCGSTHQLHFDHVIPISRGGANTIANIQLLCGACNRAKGAKLKLSAAGAASRVDWDGVPREKR